MGKTITLLLLFVLGSAPLFSQEEGFEFINPPMTIVVLGSSTAAGAGTRPIDSAWVNRYRVYVQGFNPNNRVINLAKGGYNSYKLMPTDSDLPRNRPIPDTARNISKALEFNPDGVIINLPSNDISNGYSVEEQLSNFRKYRTILTANNVDLWVTTTQPRNFPSERKRVLQRDLKDSLNAIFPDRCIDFWEGFCDDDFRIFKKFDSGDGCHLNNGGHRILMDRVLESQAFQQELYASSYQREIANVDEVEVSPNLLEVGFNGKIDFDSEGKDVQRFVTISQEGRTIKAVGVNVKTSKYKIQAIIDLRYPVVLSFEAPNSLTKAVELRFDELVKDNNTPDPYYPIEDLSMQEIFNQKLTYQFPNNYFTVAKFYYDSTKNRIRFDGNYTSEQRQRIEDALIKAPSKGRKLVTYWENGNKKAVLKFKKGQLNGKAKWFHENGEKQRFVQFKNGQYHGKYIEYDEEGELKRERVFKNDAVIGV